MAQYSGPNPRILSDEEVYSPSDDSFLLEESIKVEKGSQVLDMGTGTGIQAIRAALLGARRIVAIDINPHASRCASKNVRLNGLTGLVSVITGDLFSSLREGVLFDIVLFNPPYLRTKSSEYRAGWLEKAWAGGPRGRVVIDRFIDELSGRLQAGGVALIVHPSSGAKKTIRRLRIRGMEVSTVRSKKIFFDKLLVLSAQQVDPPRLGRNRSAINRIK
ncbi:MAG: HemK2/MTQ2 family protein methyltransferase [Promethearchaeati archaeon SRVP18_Atabeyarchaeia-1]